MELYTAKGEPFLVSSEDYSELSKFKWHISSGYVRRSYKKDEEGEEYLSRYIFKNILNKDIKDLEVDHKDRNPLNNQRSNLRDVTSAENSMNKEKRDGCTSIYKGTHFSKNDNKWYASITIDGKQYRASYDTENECAWQYNLWIDKFKLYTAIKNKVDEPLDFILWKKPERTQNLPQNIYKTKNGIFITCVQYDNKKICNSKHDTEEEALVARDAAYKLRDKLIKDKQNIKYNKDNEAIIESSNKNKLKIIVDKDLYDNLIKINWKLNTKSNKVEGKITDKYIQLHKYIMNHKDINTIIFHIDFNVLNNKKTNLIEIPKNIYNLFTKPIISTNSDGTTSYIGVSYQEDRNKWRARMGNKQIGSFNTEEEAYKARTKELEELKAEYLPNYYFRKYFENLTI